MKEDDAQTPPIVPRARPYPLAPPNYVTPSGLAQLRTELAQLEAERTLAETNHDNDTDRTHRLPLLHGRLALLAERLGSARVVEPSSFGWAATTCGWAASTAAISS